jgi:hypothetical protein
MTLQAKIYSSGIVAISVAIVGYLAFVPEKSSAG